METRPSNAVPFAPHAPVRVEAAPVREAVRTELNPPQAIAAQVGAEKTRWQKDKSSPEPAPRQKNSVTTDRDTGDLVYQVLDPGTRAVLVQTPHEAILKLRAYLHGAERRREDVHTEAVAQEHHKTAENETGERKSA